MNFICFLFRLDWALDYLELEASQIIIYLLFNVCVRVWTEGGRRLTQLMLGCLETVSWMCSGQSYPGEVTKFTEKRLLLGNFKVKFQ